MSAERTNHYIVLGTNSDGDVVILETTFQHSDSFKGATGAILERVSAETIDEFSEVSEVEAYYEEIWRGDAGRINGTTLGLSKWIDENVDEAEYLDSRFEPYTDMEDEDITEALGEDAPERYALIGCGRIFPLALAGLNLIDSDEVRKAVELIREFEGM